MRINLVALCYRGSYFYKQYGPAIRDLQMTLTLKKINCVSVTILERPVSIPERVLGKTYDRSLSDDFEISVHDKTTCDFIGPAFRRLWFEKLIPGFLDQYLEELRCDDSLNIFLDFMPIGAPTKTALKGWFYWYDFIDNFTKHNRFNYFERKAALRKYNFVKQHADLLTFVTHECRESVDPLSEAAGRSVILTNKVFETEFAATDVKFSHTTKTLFDFGFIGFITDKFDLQAVMELAENYTVAIYGDFFDSSIKRQLNRMPNVTLFGGFHYSELAAICETFCVGLLPYLKEKSHDGSPLKLYEYLRYRRPVVTSIDYEVINSDFIFNYKENGFEAEALERLIGLAGSEALDNLLQKDDYFEAPLMRIINIIADEAAL